MATTATGLSVRVEQASMTTGEAVVAVVLLDQVAGQRDHAGVGVVGQGAQALGEQLDGVGAATPDVQRVHRLQPRVERRRRAG